jgi:hypothetical protein
MNQTNDDIDVIEDDQIDSRQRLNQSSNRLDQNTFIQNQYREQAENHNGKGGSGKK